MTKKTLKMTSRDLPVQNGHWMDTIDAIWQIAAQLEHEGATSIKVQACDNKILVTAFVLEEDKV